LLHEPFYKLEPGGAEVDVLVDKVDEHVNESLIVT